MDGLVPKEDAIKILKKLKSKPENKVSTFKRNSLY
jgi:hypothetical protein